MDADGATLFGIFPMHDEPILPDEVANSGRNQLEDMGEGVVDCGALASGGADALRGTIGKDFGDGVFKRGGDL